MKQFNVNVAPIMKKLEMVSRKGLSGVLSGTMHSVFKGRGLEFHGFRAYDPMQDDAKQIDWEASLRSQKTVVKELVEERNNNIIFLIDVSSSMSFGSTDLLKNEYAIQLFTTMAFSFIESGDSVGLAMFSDHIVKSIKPNIGTRQYYNLLKEVTKPENYEGKFDISEAIKDLNRIITQQSIIILISDFIGLHGQWRAPLKILCAKHEVITFIVRDPRDLIMPQVGQVFVEDPYTGETLLIDTNSIKKEYEEHMKNENKFLEKIFKEIGAEYKFAITTDPIKKTIMSFLNQRLGR